MSVASKVLLGLKHVQGRMKNLPQTKITDEVVIDKDVAEELLKLNVHNRRITWSKVSTYAAQMLRGRWIEIGDSIKISKTGVLLNGQHTLLAIAQADVSHEYSVVWGLDDRGQKYMDTGTKRSLSAALGLDGEVNPNLLGGAIRLIWQIENGGTPGKWLTEPTYEEYSEYLASHPEIRDSVQVASKVGKSLPIPPSVVGAAHYLCADVDQSEADYFFLTVGDLSVGVPADSVIAMVRERIINRKKRGSVSRMEQAALYDFLVKVFDMHRDNPTAQSLVRIQPKPRKFRLPRA